MVANHPFVDGNKRTALTTTAVLYSIVRFASVSPEAVSETLYADD